MPPRKLTLPDTQALDDQDGARRFAPSAGRNADPIRGALRDMAPASGRVLELASGTGQHIAHWARALPELDWQPSDVAPDNLPSIRAWAAHAGCSNLRPPLLLDAGQPGWHEALPAMDLIIAVNLLHLITTPEAQALIAGAAQLLRPDGRLVLYGPFRRESGFISPGDAEFHARLRAQDPTIGYKNVQDVQRWMAEAGLCTNTPRPLPANNLILSGNHIL